MAEEKHQPSGPDLAHGIALSVFTGQTLLGMSAIKMFCSCAPARISLPSKRIAATITGRLPTGSWSPRASAAPGTAPVSICRPAKQAARPRSLRWQSGRSIRRAIASLFGERANGQSRAVGDRLMHPTRS
jgi:hypothetical protein